MADNNELGELASAELIRLQRQIRLMENEFNSLLDEKKHTIKKQQKLIGILQSEYDKLKDEINFLQDGPHAKKQNLDEKKLENALKKHNKILTALNQKKTSLWELEEHIRKIEKQIEVLRKNEITDSCYKDTIVSVQKDVVKLENRLDVANKRCSAVVSENAKLREMVDHMLQERANFNDMWQTMVNEFNRGKKYIIDLIEQSAVAFDQREELCSKLQTVKDKNESDKMIHIQEMRELQRKLEYDAKLQRFYEIKSQKRVNSELEAREANKKLMQKEDLEQQITHYEKILLKIKTMTGVEDVNQLAAQFTTQEEENFALFNYVNELSHEVEILNEVVQKLSYDIERQKDDERENIFKEESENLEHLEKNKAALELQAESASTERNMHEEKLKKLLEGIESIFKLIRCNEAPILGILNSQDYLTVHNVKLFLGVIDKRINMTINNMATIVTPSTVLAKKDRIPKFNVREFVKIK